MSQPQDDYDDAMTALSTPSITQEEIERLLKHPSPAVRGHALLASLTPRVPHLGEDELNALLDAHAGDGGVSLGVRHLIARADGVPRRILLRLADDDADFIADCARARLNQ